MKRYYALAAYGAFTTACHDTELAHVAAGRRLLFPNSPFGQLRVISLADFVFRGSMLGAQSRHVSRGRFNFFVVATINVPWAYFPSPGVYKHTSPSLDTSPLFRGTHPHTSHFLAMVITRALPGMNLRCCTVCTLSLTCVNVRVLGSPWCACLSNDNSSQVLPRPSFRPPPSIPRTRSLALKPPSVMGPRASRAVFNNPAHHPSP